MFRNYERSFEYTGKNTEEELLASVKKDEYVDSRIVKNEREEIVKEKFGHYNDIERQVHKKEINKEVFEELSNSHRFRFSDAINLVKGSQPKHLPFFAKNLEKQLATDMESELGSEDVQLDFFTAINSHLDRGYGVDGFFTIKTEFGEVILTIDLTSNPNKVNYKADYILTVPDGGFDEIEERKEIIDFNKEEARKLTEMYTNKIKDKKEKSTGKRTKRRRISLNKNY